MKISDIIKSMAIILGMTAIVSCSDIAPHSLSCEQMAEPNSIDIANPRLSWINAPKNEEIKGAHQSAFQIRVASSKRGLKSADLWDSGKIESEESYLISYEGNTLASGTDCWWQVRVWDGNGKASAWSKAAHWTMGMMNQEEWKADWIGAPWFSEAADTQSPISRNSPRQPSAGRVLDTDGDKAAPMFRKSFTLEKRPISAKVFVTGLGYFEFYANGKRIGDECLAPNFTCYTKRDGLQNASIPVEDNFRDYRVMYLVYDLTDVLKKGDNAIGLLVGNGWYNTHGTRWPASFGSPRMICQLQIKYSDGSEETIVSDTSWKTAKSAIVKNDEYRGETFDARVDIKGWSEALFDDSAWENAVDRIAPIGVMTASNAPLDHVTEILKPISIEKIDNGFEVDFGKTISGWIHFNNVLGKAGDTLRVSFISEEPNGEQRYIFANDKCSDYAPKFAWYVFRKAIVSGVENLTEENLRAEMVNTYVESSSEFHSSDQMLEQINDMWRLTQLDNMHGGIASDCPHREKSPYTGDGQVVCQTVMSNFDAAAFYNKWIRDIRDMQNVETGYVPNAAPWQPGCGGGVAWGAAMNIMPWEYYRYYGDEKILSDSYYAMKEQLRYMLNWVTEDGTMYQQIETYSASSGKSNVNYWMNLGEWCPAFENPDSEIVHSFYLWLCATNTAKAASILRPEEAAEYEKIAADVWNAFHKKFYNPQTGSYGDNGANVFALYMGVPEEYRSRVVEALRYELEEVHNSHLATGIFGTRYLFQVLSENGLNELAYKIMTATDFPGFGYWLSKGSTTMWEHWQDQNSSKNHPMFGGCLTWFYEYLAGVQIDENMPGYKHIIFRPYLVNNLNQVSWSKNTPYGEVKSDLTHNGGKGTLRVTIPVGSTAMVYLPGKSEAIELAQGTYSLDF